MSKRRNNNQHNVDRNYNLAYVSPHGRCRHTAGVATRQVSPHGRCRHTTGVATRQVSPRARCRHVPGVTRCQVSPDARCHQMSIVTISEVWHVTINESLLKIKISVIFMHTDMVLANAWKYDSCGFFIYLLAVAWGGGGAEWHPLVWLSPDVWEILGFGDFLCKLDFYLQTERKEKYISFGRKKVPSNVVCRYVKLHKNLWTRSKQKRFESIFIFKLTKLFRKDKRGLEMATAKMIRFKVYFKDFQKINDLQSLYGAH